MVLRKWLSVPSSTFGSVEHGGSQGTLLAFNVLEGVPTGYSPQHEAVLVVPSSDPAPASAVVDPLPNNVLGFLGPMVQLPAPLGHHGLIVRLSVDGPRAAAVNLEDGQPQSTQSDLRQVKCMSMLPTFGNK